MDRDELIARLRKYVREYEDAPNWGGPTMYPAPPSLEDIKAVLAALESRPAPTDEREETCPMCEGREPGPGEACIAGCRHGKVRWTSANVLRNVKPVLEGYQREIERLNATVALATDTTPSRALPIVLREVSIEDAPALCFSKAGWVEGYNAARADLAALAPSRDEEGSVDREAIARIIREHHRTVTRYGKSGVSAKTFHIGDDEAADAILALKTSTPETQKDG